MGFSLYYSSKLFLPKPRFWTNRGNISSDGRTSLIRYTPSNLFCRFKCNSTPSNHQNGNNSSSFYQNCVTPVVEKITRTLTIILSIFSFIRDMTLYIFYSFHSKSPYSADAYASALNKIARERDNKLRSISTALIKETLQNVVRFQELMDSETRSCTICLQEFGREDEVRRLRNCGHVFHGLCLDGWMEQKQTRCPVCSVDLVLGEVKDEFEKRMEEATAAVDAYINSRYFCGST